MMADIILYDSSLSHQRGEVFGDIPAAIGMEYIVALYDVIPQDARVTQHVIRLFLGHA